MLPADTYHRSQDTTVLLRSGLNLIQQALSIYNSDLKLVFANKRFEAMFGLPAELIQPGAEFGETIRYLAEAGEYGSIKNVGDYVKERVAQALNFEQHYVERQRSNGRWISVEGGPLRQGGWIAVYTDITDIRRQEDMLRERSDDLSGKLLDRSEELARANRALEATINRFRETQQHLEAAEARVRLAAETTPAHIARLDRQEIYTYSNRRLPLSAANGVDNIIGHTAADVLGPSIYQEIAPALRSALVGEAKVVEFKISSDGRTIRAAFTPDKNASDLVTGVYVLSMDVTSHATGEDTHNSLRNVAKFGEWTARFDLFELQNTDVRKNANLTVTESSLLRFLLEKSNRLIVRDEIINAPNIDLNSERALDIRISRLRQKLRDDAKSPKIIRTIYGAGYILVGDVAWEK